MEWWLSLSLLTFVMKKYSDQICLSMQVIKFQNDGASRCSIGAFGFFLLRILECCLLVTHVIQPYKAPEASLSIFESLS